MKNLLFYDKNRKGIFVTPIFLLDYEHQPLIRDVYDVTDLTKKPFQNIVQQDPFGFYFPITNQRISLDFDGTLTRNPVVFSEFTKKLKCGGAKIFVITGRTEEQRFKVEKFLRENKILYDSVIYYPGIYIEEEDLLTDILIGKWKGEMIRANDISIHIDDNPTHIEAAREVAKDVLFLTFPR